VTVARTSFVPAGRSAAVMPVTMGRSGLIAAGHYLASSIGAAVLRDGGTAIDAGIAAGFAINVLEFDQTNFAGVAPIILRDARSGHVATLDGLGVWPRRASAELIRAQGGVHAPRMLHTVTPGAPDAWLTALARFGTRSLGDVLEPAWELALAGAPISAKIAHHLATNVDVDQLYPTTREAFYPDGRTLQAGERFARPELARVLKALMDAEARARHDGADRATAIAAARDLFYRGWIAEELVAFHEQHGGLLRADDLGAHRVEVGVPVAIAYGGVELLSCGAWCQGPALLEMLALAAQLRLGEQDPDSAVYLHLVVELIDRALADREAYFGDPRHVDVPLDGLLAPDYARVRAATIDRDRASGRMPEPGNPWPYERAEWRARNPPSIAVEHLAAPGAPVRSDTSYVAAIDAEGNLFSATPSDPVLDVPVVPSLGFPCSGRGYQSRPEQGHASEIGPRRRPRLTPCPMLALRDGKPLLAIGCPGGDAQVQAMLQVLLRMLDHGADPQEAVEAPRVVSRNFPNSFAPHVYEPGVVEVEGRVPQGTRDELAAMGHLVRTVDDWSFPAAAIQIALRDPATGALIGASDPRTDGAAIGC
jgi:gamma-glutamyltranspeptidase/glutathione hydrolase